jgi:phosphoglycerol transferase MdoB-like AlkP superfamily enzyme
VLHVAAPKDSALMLQGQEGGNSVARKPRLLTRELRFLGLVFVFSMLMLTCFRLLFLLVYGTHFGSVPAGEILLAHVHGLRFDAATCAIGLGGALVLSGLPVVNRIYLFRWLWILVATGVVAVLFLLSVADLQYFRHSGKRLGYEAFAYLDSSILPILRTSAADQPHYIVLALVFLAVFVLLARVVVRRMDLIRPEPVTWKTYVLVYLILAPVLFVFARGGVQRVPLGISDSFISSHSAVSTLTINGPYLAFRSLGKQVRVNLMDSEQARRIATQMLGIRSEDVIDPDYPILVRTARESDTALPYNVVIILLESWAGKFVGPNGDTLGVTPRLNRLAEQGLLFNRFFASGFRSTSGLFCTLTGICDQVGKPVMRRAELSNNFGSLSNLLRKQGYRNIFVYGGALDFDNVDNMLVHERFDVIVGQKDFRGCDDMEGAWGFADECIYSRAHKEFLRCGDQPFFGMVFTVSSHAPYDLPDERFAIFDESHHPDHAFLNACHYADWALGEYLQKAQAAGYLENTIFVITSDHTYHGGNLDLFENQHIPLLLYAPGLIEPGVRATIGSQVDILPTVAALLDLPHRAALGRDLLSVDEKDGFALWVAGQGVGWAEKDYIALVGLDGRRPAVYDLRTRDFGTNIAAQDTMLADSIRLRAGALYQLSSDLLRSNSIIPAEYIE